MAWIILIVAGLLETAWAWLLKSSNGFTVFWPSAGFVVTMLASVYLLGLSLKYLPLGTAYAVWTGIGAVTTALVGIAFLGESRDPLRLACIGLIVLGVVGLKFATPGH